MSMMLQVKCTLFATSLLVFCRGINEICELAILDQTHTQCLEQRMSIGQQVMRMYLVNKVQYAGWIAGVKATAMVLLKAGADVQAADKLGRRALDVAEDGAHMKLAEFLRQWLPSPAPATSSPPPSQPECSSPAAPAAFQGEWEAVLQPSEREGWLPA